MILCAGDSFSVFKTPNCNNPIELLEGTHAVELLSHRYGVPCASYGTPGAGIQESVMLVLKGLNHVVDAKLLVYYISRKNRVPVETKRLPGPTIAEKLKDLDTYCSINNIGKLLKRSDNLSHYIRDRSLLTMAKALKPIPKFKIDYDDIAYLSLLVNVCKCKDINILFVSEYTPPSDDMLYLFSNQDEIEFCDSFMHHEFDLDPIVHAYETIHGNHFCPHYQLKICDQIVNKHDEFIRKSLQ